MELRERLRRAGAIACSRFSTKWTQMRVELVDRLQEVEQERLRLDDRQEELGQQSDEARAAGGASCSSSDAELAETREELARAAERTGAGAADGSRLPRAKRTIRSCATS